MTRCLIGARGGTYLNHCVSSNTCKLILSCGSILNYANLCHGLGQSDVQPNLDDEPLGVNKPPVEPPPVEPPPVEPPVEPPDEPPYTELVFNFGTKHVDFCLVVHTNYYGFLSGISAYFDTSPDNLGLSNTYKNVGTDPGNGLDSTALFKPKPSAE